MISKFEQMISEGTLAMRKAPTPNRFSEWINDERLTPILTHYLHTTALPFIEREFGAIIDSSKVSQLMNASAMGVDYFGDERDGAHWMKCNAIVGVETMVVMDVAFSGLGDDSHDINFLKPLVNSVCKVFPLKFLLADKAYLSEANLQFLWGEGIRAAIPVKKKYWEDPNKAYSQPIMALVEWYDRRYRDFHEVYRLRTMIEALFSLMKRMADGHCWSRGRQRKVDNPYEPSTAWKNEVLCKLIYTNLRATVTLEEETGVEIDYLVRERRFYPPPEPLLKVAA